MLASVIAKGLVRALPDSISIGARLINPQFGTDKTQIPQFGAILKLNPPVLTDVARSRLSSAVLGIG